MEATGIIDSIKGRWLSVRCNETWIYVAAKYRKHSYMIGQRITIYFRDDKWSL